MLTVHRRNLFPNLLLGELPIPWFSGEVDIKHTLHKFYTLAGHCVDDLLRKRGEKKLYATSALFRLKKKYPLYFLLFPAPKAKANHYGVYPYRK